MLQKQLYRFLLTMLASGVTLFVFSQNVNYQVYDRQYYTGIGNTDFWTDDDPSWRLVVYHNVDAYASYAGVIWMVDDGLDGAAWFNPADGNLRSVNNTSATGIKVSLESWEDDACGARNQYNTGCSNNDDNPCGSPIGTSISGVISFRNDPPCQWNNYQYDCSGNWKGQYKIYWDWAVAPTITSQPTPDDRNVCSPSTTTLTVVADAAARFYQWQINTNTDAPQAGCASSGWTNIAGATSSSYIVPFTAGTRQYRVLITSNCTADFASLTTTSNCVRVNGFPYAPTIQSGACGSGVLLNSTVAFSVPVVPNAGAIANANYTWATIAAGPAIVTSPGANGSTTATTANITFNTSGTYTVEVTVDDNGGPCPSTTSTCVVTVSAPLCDFVYVDPVSGSDAFNGSSLDPKQTIGNALLSATASRNYIRLKSGTYTEGKLTIPLSNVVIDGDYTESGGVWTKDISQTTTVNINSSEQNDGTQAFYIGVEAISKNNWTIQDVNINVRNTTSGGQISVSSNTFNSRGKTLYGAYTRNCTGYEFLRSTMSVGNASHGGNGTNQGTASNGLTGFNGNNGSCDGGNGGATGTRIGPGTGIRKGGNGGPGGAGGPEGYTTGSAGSLGSNGGGGAARDPSAGGGGGRSSCDGGDGGSASASTGTKDPSTGTGATGSPNYTAGNRPTSGQTGYYTTGGVYFTPGGAANSGGDGGGGGGAAGGGGGGGQGENCCWCVCNDGGGNGGGSGGTGAQGGLAGTGAYGAGGNFSIYAYGAGTGTLTGSTFTSGTVGTGGTGGNGGGGGTGGNGGTGASVCTGEVGRGGNGSKGGNGGTGGRGRDGVNGLQANIRIENTAVVNNNGLAQPNNPTVLAYKGCSNSEITITKTTGSWVNPPSPGSAFENDISSAVSSYGTGSTPAVIYYTTAAATGFKDLTVNGVTYKNLINLRDNTRTAPTINAISTPICKDGTINLGTPTLSTTTGYNWSVKQISAPNSPAAPGAELLTAAQQVVQNPGNITLANPDAADRTYQVRLKVQHECCGWSIPTYFSVTVRPALVPGSINGTQTICYNGNPALLGNVSSASGGAGVFTYEWQYQGNCTGLWTAIVSSNSTTYDPPCCLTSDRCYRRKVTNDCGDVDYSNTITVTVNDDYVPGGITGGGGTLCSGDDPGAMTANPTGGSGTYSYQWQSKSGTVCDPTGWSNIGGATSQTYDPPAGIASTTIYRCLIDDVGSPDCGAQTASTNCITVTVLPTGTWTGATNTDWFTASNWCGGVPTSTTNITIPQDANNMPDIFAAGAVCQLITINSGASLTISTTYNLDVYGNWTNNGTFTANSSTVTFKGSTNRTISGSSTTTFYSLIMNKGTSVSSTMENTSTFTMAAGGNLTLTNGLLKVSANGTVRFASAPTIPSTAGIEFNGGSLVQGDYDITNNGTFRLTSSSGTINIGNVASHTITTTGTSVFNIAGGSFIVTGGIVASGSADVDVTGGSITLTTLAFSSANSTFDIAGAAAFDVTAGSLTMQNANSGAGYDISIIAGTGTKTNITNGAVINIGNASTTSGQTFDIDNSAIEFDDITIFTGKNTTVRLQSSTTLGTSGVLTLNDGKFNLNRNELTAKNGTNSAISRTTGYIISEDAVTPFNSGKVTWNINDAVLHIFPFGNAAGTYLPFHYTKTGGTNANISVCTYNAGDNTDPVSSGWYPPTVTSLNGIGGADLSEEIIRRFWYIDATGGSPTATVRFYWDDGAGATKDLPISGSINTNTRMQRWNGGSWDLPIAGQNVQPASDYIEITGVNSFSPWVAKTDAVAKPLPITLSSFEANCEKNIVDIKWFTSTEINNEYFTVERSKDGERFIPITKINGSGNSNSVKKYNYTDHNPVKGFNYYRIKQTDFDGKYSYSAIEVTECSEGSFNSIVLFPNPTREYVSVFISCEFEQASGKLEITDIGGKVVFEQDVIINDSEANLLLNITSIPSGNYNVSLNIDGCSFEIKKLIVL